MPRQPRIDIPDVPQHLFTRGNNRGACFVNDQDRWVFLNHLGKACVAADCDLHAYVLMTNHVHLLATGRSRGALSQMMQSVGRRYARYVNVRHGRTGALFEGRFKSSLIETERYFITCMRYIELNPVRAAMVGLPAEYPWSSHRDNASGTPGGLLTPHEQYLRLAREAPERGTAYRALFTGAMAPEEVERIRVALAKSRVLGSKDFCRALKTQLCRNVDVTPPGRPRKRGQIEK
jgi:putative transposase